MQLNLLMIAFYVADVMQYSIRIYDILLLRVKTKYEIILNSNTEVIVHEHGAFRKTNS